MWSLAVVCVRCLTDRLPFVDLAQRGLLAFGSALRPSELDGVPEPVARVLAAALRFEAAERPADAGQFRSQLFSSLEELAPDQSWPDGSSVGFPEHESELGRALSALVQAAGGGGKGTQDPIARPLDVFTRTLSRAWPSVWLGRPGRRRWFALLTALLLGALLLVRGNRHSSAGVSRLSAEPAESALEMTDSAPLITVTAAPGGTALATAAGATRPPLAADPAASGRARASSSAPSRAAAPAAGARREHAGARPEHAESAAPMLGANRSPIIE